MISYFIFIDNCLYSELPNPKLIAYSPKVLHYLGLAEKVDKSEEFLGFFSGMTKIMSSEGSQGFQSWATPYALSIMNKEFEIGNIYGGE